MKSKISDENSTNIGHPTNPNNLAVTAAPAVSLPPVAQDITFTLEEDSPYKQSLDLSNGAKLNTFT